MTRESTPLLRRAFDSADLLRRHPPRFADRNKRAVFEAISRPGRARLEVTRWGALPLPDSVGSHRAAIAETPGFFEYQDAPRPGHIVWHLNFAAADAFEYYAGNLLAQDELQVLEHPVLGSLREATGREGFSIACVEKGSPTPVLVSGVERWGALDTRPAPGRPGGLYGREFAPADPKQVLSALRRIEPATLTNVLAIEAPSYGSGRYDRETIRFVLQTAHSGFAAAVSETRHLAGARSAAHRCVIHTGHWGTGAYGGDRELMAALQLVAADLAGVDELVFHTGFGSGGDDAFAAARAVHRELHDLHRTGDVLDRLVSRGYEWGGSNGT